MESATALEPEPEPEPEPEEFSVDPRVLFRLCDVHGFSRAAATDALRTTTGDFDDALGFLLSRLSSGPRDSSSVVASWTGAEVKDAQLEELDALAAIFDSAFSRPTDRRCEIRLQREEPPVTLTLSVLATESYPKTPPLVALCACGLLPATNQRLTQALAQRAFELTEEDDESVKVFELCSWITDELDGSLLVDPREDRDSVVEPDVEPHALEVAQQVVASQLEAERQAGRYTYEVAFRDGSVGKVYASVSARLLRPLGSKGVAHPGVEYEVGSKVEARLDQQASFERADVLSRRAVGSGETEHLVQNESDGARQQRQLELQRREELQRRGKGANRASTLELYANSRKDGKVE